VTRAALTMGAVILTLGFGLGSVPVHAQDRCIEDDPSGCWSWSKHGNQRRGITTTSGRHIVVGPCRFAKLDRRDRIDRTQTPKLKGDGWARRHGCC
jgi:hypothetical protein